MSVAHVELLDTPVEEAAPRRDTWRLAAVVGGVGMLGLAAVPGVFAVLLLIRPDLFLSR
jgi:hypothetical protein